MTSKRNYQGLYSYAKENKQSRNLFQEYWQEDKRQAPNWHNKLNPKLERASLASLNIISLQTQASSVLNIHKDSYAGLFDYAKQHAVHSDIFRTQVHPNLSNWQASLKYEKGLQLQLNIVEEAA